MQLTKGTKYVQQTFPEFHIIFLKKFQGLQLTLLEHNYLLPTRKHKRKPKI